MYTADVLNDIGEAIFTDTGMAESAEEASYLWQWAVQHKRIGTDLDAVWAFWQMLAWRNPDIGAAWLDIDAKRIRLRCKKLYPHTQDYMSKVTDKQFRQAVIRP